MCFSRMRPARCNRPEPRLHRRVAPGVGTSNCSDNRNSCGGYPRDYPESSPCSTKKCFTPVSEAIRRIAGIFSRPAWRQIWSACSRSSERPSVRFAGPCWPTICSRGRNGPALGKKSIFAGYVAWALGFLVGILPFLPIPEELKSYLQPAAVYSFVVGFLAYLREALNRSPAQSSQAKGRHEHVFET